MPFLPGTVDYCHQAKGNLFNDFCSMIAFVTYLINFDLSL